jgi:hypothetical protein
MEKIRANLIIEILGRPPENVTEALTGIVDKLNTEKGMKIIDKTIHKPVTVKDSKDLYTSFAEVMVELDSVAHYFQVLFAYMPSHIEIISPSTIDLSNYDLNQIGNILAQRLHNYDAVAKNTIAERDIILEKLREIAPHLFKQQAPEQSIPPLEKAPKKEKKQKKNKKK